MRTGAFPVVLGIFCCHGAVWAQSSVTALVTDVYDGDTFTVDAEVWPDIGWTGSVRVRNVDTPENLRVSSADNAALSSDSADASEISIDDPLALYDDNGNGRITCAEAGAHGIAPVRRNHPAYPHMTDGDGDGVVCE